MPIYEYKCENGHVFDAMQKFSDEPLSECGECGAPAARVLSAPAIHFKGSGFHNTDYGTRKKGAASEGGGESKGLETSTSSESGSAGSSGDSGGESKSDSKASAATAD